MACALLPGLKPGKEAKPREACWVPEERETVALLLGMSERRYKGSHRVSQVQGQKNTLCRRCGREGLEARGVCVGEDASRVT